MEYEFEQNNKKNKVKNSFFIFQWYQNTINSLTVICFVSETDRLKIKYWLDFRNILNFIYG